MNRSVGVPRRTNLGFVSRLALVGVAVGTANIFGASPTPLLPRVVDVQHELVKDEVKPTRSYLKMRSTKFSTYLDTPAYEVFYVTWDAGSSLAPATSLILEYQQERAKVGRAMKVACAAGLRGGKRTTLTIPPGEVAAAGPVKAWRVRLTQGPRTVAQLASPNWNRP